MLNLFENRMAYRRWAMQIREVVISSKVENASFEKLDFLQKADYEIKNVTQPDKNILLFDCIISKSFLAKNKEKIGEELAKLLELIC
jgi:hypothetical protein